MMHQGGAQAVGRQVTGHADVGRHHGGRRAAAELRPASAGRGLPRQPRCNRPPAACGCVLLPPLRCSMALPC